MAGQFLLCGLNDEICIDAFTDADKHLTAATAESVAAFAELLRSTQPEPLSIRIGHVQVDRELREVLAGAGAVMRAALDAAAQLVTAATGGADAVVKFPFARSHLRALARYHSGPSAPVTRESWLVHLRVAWRDIDAAVAAVQEIQFDARHRTSTS